MSVDALDRAISATLLPGFAGLEAPSWLERELEDGLAGVCLFGMNIADRDQVRALTARLRRASGRPVIAVDEEGGEVARLDHATGSPTPTAAHLGRIDDAALTRSVYAAIGADLAGVGITLDFAPVADVNVTPRNPVIGTRSFGSDAGLVARHVAAAVQGLHDAGIGAVAKHFPGHGDTVVDSHLGLPTVDAPLGELRGRELVPFAGAIGAGVDAIMTSHILLPGIDPDAPATMSRRILVDLLRDELGFGGVIVSDALDMAGASGEIGIPEAAVRALAAGCDLLCLGTANTPDQLDQIRAAVRRAVRDGRLAEGRVVAAGERVRRLPAPVGAGSSGAGGMVAGEGWAQDRGLAVRQSVAPVGPGATYVRVQATPNNAVGAVEWGIGAYLAPSLGGRADGARFVDVRAGGDVSEAVGAAAGHPLVVQARGISLDPDTRATVDAIRAARPDAILVEEGWPDPDDPWDVAAYGASRLLSLHLFDALARGMHPHTEGAA